MTLGKNHIRRWRRGSGIPPVRSFDLHRESRRQPEAQARQPAGPPFPPDPPGDALPDPDGEILGRGRSVPEGGRVAVQVLVIEREVNLFLHPFARSRLLSSAVESDSPTGRNKSPGAAPLDPLTPAGRKLPSAPHRPRQHRPETVVVRAEVFYQISNELVLLILGNHGAPADHLVDIGRPLFLIHALLPNDVG